MASNHLHHGPTADAYARSLLELANEGQQQAQAIGEELSAIVQIIQANPSFSDFLADPGIAESERTAALDRIFRGRVSQLMMNFLGVLNVKGRLRLLPQIGSAYEELLDEQLGNVEVDVTVAQRLGPAELEQVRTRVSQALGKNAIVHQYVDDSIIGGLILRVQDELIDSSVRYQLSAMRAQLLASRPR